MTRATKVMRGLSINENMSLKIATMILTSFVLPHRRTSRLRRRPCLLISFSFVGMWRHFAILSAERVNMLCRGMGTNWVAKQFPSQVYYRWKNCCMWKYNKKIRELKMLRLHRYRFIFQTSCIRKRERQKWLYPKIYLTSIMRLQYTECCQIW